MILKPFLITIFLLCSVANYYIEEDLKQLILAPGAANNLYSHFPLFRFPGYCETNFVSFCNILFDIELLHHVNAKHNITVVYRLFLNWSSHREASILRDM